MTWGCGEVKPAVVVSNGGVITKPLHFPSNWERLQERMEDALALNGDEGRSVAAISFGEVPNNR